jgi:hypothetical protein
MGFDDGSADAKPHAGTVSLGGKKCIEYLVCLLRGNPYAGIADGYLNLLVFCPLRLDGHLTGSVHVLHCINAVDDQIHRNLLQLHAISDDLRKIAGKFRLN